MIIVTGEAFELAEEARDVDRIGVAAAGGDGRARAGTGDKEVQATTILLFDAVRRGLLGKKENPLN